MRRRLLNLLTALSLLLCVATCAMWARSRRVNDAAYYFGDTQLLELHQAHGMVLAGWGRKLHNESAGWSHGARPALRPDVYRWAWRSHGGFAAYREAMTMNCYGANVWRVVVPHWILVAAFATLPASYVIVIVRGSSRATKGLCRRCGYDLRASPDRCPECGMTAAVRTGAGI